MQKYAAGDDDDIADSDADVGVDDTAFDDDGDTAKSKSQVKREWRALLPLARDLVALPERQLRAMPLPEAVMEALALARNLKRGALQRQLRYCVGLLAREDHDAAAQALAALRKPLHAEVEAMHEVEAWREALIDGDQATLSNLIARFPTLDRQHINQLIRASQKERAGHHAPKSARLLFKYLAALRAGG